MGHGQETRGWRAIGPRRAAATALLLASVFFGLHAVLVSALPTCTSTWTGSAGDGLWTTAGNWNGGVPNTSTSVACIELSGASVSLTQVESIQALVLGTGGAGTSTLTVDSSGSTVELSASSASTIQQGGTLVLETSSSSSEAILAGSGSVTNDGTIDSEVSSTGTTNQLNVALSNTANLDVLSGTLEEAPGSAATTTNSGTVTIGPAGVLDLANSFATFDEGAGGTLAFDIAGGSTFGVINAAGGTFSLAGGTADPVLQNGYVPSGGTVFKVVEDSNGGGTFTTIENEWTATYSAVATGGTAFIDLIAPDPTTTGLGSSANPSTTGQQVTYTATVNPTPTGGTVDFTDGGTTISGCGTAAVNTTTGQATCQVTYGSVGPHAIVASYSGHPGFDGSQSSTLNQTVQATTATGLGSSANPSTTGQQVTYTATVTPTPDAGTVNFTDDGTTISGCGTVAVNTTTGQATCQITYNSTGIHSIQAVFSGDTSYVGSTSSTLMQTVNNGTATTTSTVVKSSANPSTTGQQVTYTATVTPIPDGGTVNFTDDGTTISGCGTLAVNTTTGQATCQFTYRAAGSHSIQAVYSGDVNYDGSTSSTLVQTVQAPTTTGLGSSANPSMTGQQVTYTATVSPTPDGGTVNFTDDGTTISGCGTVAVNTTTGEATCEVTYGAIGSHPIQAVYSGDTLYIGSTSSTLTQTVQIATTTALASSGSPSALGSQVTYTATVSPTPDGGTVAFTDDGSTISGCGAVALSSGVATCQVTYAAAGSHSIQTSYSGDSDYQGSTSTVLTQVVNQASTSTALASSMNPSPTGQVTYTATVSPTPDGGAVDFTDDGATIAGCGAVALSGGKATCQITYSGSGTHSIQAIFSGDANYQGSTSNVITQSIESAVTSSPPTCSVSFENTKVVLQKPKHGKPKWPIGTVLLKITCDQTVDGTLSGKITITRHNSKHHVKVGPLSVSVTAGVAKIVTVKLSDEVKHALGKKFGVTASFTFSGTDANGTAHASTPVKDLNEL